jgi:DNA topoisomerase-1
MIPQNFNERVDKKKARLKELESQLEEKRGLGKKTDAVIGRIEKTKLDIGLMENTKEYNLGTSLKSYVDPRVYVEWALKVDFNLEKLYPKTLQKKYSWALEKLLKNAD